MFDLRQVVATLFVAVVLVSIPLVAVGDDCGGPSDCEETGGFIGITSVVGGVAAVAAAATAAVTSTNNVDSGPDSEDEEELAIVQVSTDRVEVDFENPATLEVQAWLSTPSRGVVQAPDIPLQIAMPPTLGLTVFPTSGSGRLDVDITVDETAEDGEVTITVSGSYKGRETRQPVTVVIGGGYRLEVY